MLLLTFRVMQGAQVAPLSIMCSLLSLGLGEFSLIGIPRVEKGFVNHRHGREERHDLLERGEVAIVQSKGELLSQLLLNSQVLYHHEGREHGEIDFGQVLQERRRDPLRALLHRMLQFYVPS